ncbi:MAG: hypothetical protein LBV12_03270 [Puniceicoccales bacterium]|jgi:hypothetical protein|nr:hypothetical protein [Puniceicoccales bacterium]
MRKSLLPFISAIAFASTCVFSHAEITPLDQKIPEEKVTLVKCPLDAKNPKIPAIGKRPVEKLDFGEYSYNLWIPKGYEASGSRKWPCVFIASPQGKAGMGAMAEHLKGSGYIVVMLQESKNGKDGHCAENFIAAHDDVTKRLRVAEGLKFATGMSGGARASSEFVQLRSGFGGLFQQAAGFAYDSAGKKVENLPKKNFCIVTTIGSNDTMNFTEWVSIYFLLPRGVPFQPLLSKAPHGWASAETATRAFMFMECTTLLNVTPSNDTKAAAKSWLTRQAQIIPQQSALADKILLAEKTLQAATKQNVGNEPALDALKKQLQQWKSDPKAATELKANDAFWKLFGKQMEALRNPFTYSNMDQAGAAKKSAEEFKNFAKKNADTNAATLAELFVVGLEKVKN